MFKSLFCLNTCQLQKRRWNWSQIISGQIQKFQRSGQTTQILREICVGQHVVAENQVSQIGQFWSQCIWNGAQNVVAEIQFSQILQGEKGNWNRFQYVAVRQKLVNTKLSEIKVIFFLFALKFFLWLSPFITKNVETRVLY